MDSITLEHCLTLLRNYAEELERLQHTVRVLEDKLAASAGYANIQLVDELLAALGIQDTPLDGQLQAAVDAVKALKENNQEIRV